VAAKTAERQGVAAELDESVSLAECGEAHNWGVEFIGLKHREDEELRHRRFLEAMLKRFCFEEALKAHIILKQLLVYLN
jgi:uncharacterized protein YfaT (DUF1175 family)